MQKRLIEINEELAQIEARSAEIHTAVETAEQADLEKLSAEITEMEERSAALIAEKAELEAKEEEARSFDESKATEIELNKTEQEEKKMFGPETKEYRDAFYAVLGNYATAEQRAIVVDSTARAMAMLSQSRRLLTPRSGTTFTQHIRSWLTSLQSGPVLQWKSPSTPQSLSVPQRSLTAHPQQPKNPIPLSRLFCTAMTMKSMLN